MGTENTGTSQRVHHGHNIASARRMKGLVQKTLADLLGMSVSYTHLTLPTKA